ncbi:ABC transporter substrate-binding protein [Modicisalibacter radicis]|uniref:ABC transporter substrate-binding protein n=1 Tax=Halomonas sp. EAR18 TaxID=2518972 RepID=UPI00109C0E82|nr:ABC transporter substrate-binding protein [Halomonas sp. EAR18]
MEPQVLEIAPTRRDRRTGGAQWFIRMLSLWLLVCASAYAGEGDARRIAVMDPGHVEILQALGAGGELALMPEDPSFRQSLLDVTRYRRLPTPEGLLAAGTTLVIGGNPGRDAPILARAESLSIESHMVSRERPALERIRRIAELVDRQAEAEILIETIQARYADAARVVAANDASPRVLHVSSSGAGTTGAVTAAGRSTAAHGLIERAGGINVGARAGLERYQSLTAEGVIAMAPQAVLVSDLELSALGGRDGIWRQVPGLAHTPASRHERLIVLPHAAVKFDAVASGDATLALARALATDVTDASP